MSLLPQKLRAVLMTASVLCLLIVCARKSYYASVKASEQLIKWLEANNCDTVYCRELTKEEVTCNTSSPTCVPEFTRAYNEALQKLKGNAELARKWVTNYAPLSSVEL